MEISTSLNVLWDNDPKPIESMIERIAAAGFKHADMNFCDWCFAGSPFVESGWERWIDGAAQRAVACGVRFTQSHGPIFPKWEATEKCKLLTELSHRSLVAAGRLGIPWVVFEPETDNGAWDAKHVDALRHRNQEWFAPLVKTAESAGTGIALENVFDSLARRRGTCRWFGSIPTELIALVDGFDHPRVGVCWDTGHAHIQGVDQGAALRAIGPRLKALHIQDSDGRDDQHLAPYYGTIKWRDIMAALRDIRYANDFTFEIHNFIRPVPEPLRDTALRFALEIGRTIVSEGGTPGATS